VKFHFTNSEITQNYEENTFLQNPIAKYPISKARGVGALVPLTASMSTKEIIRF